MDKIFIEAQHNKTSEFNFIHTVVSKHFPGKEDGIVCMGGVDKLFNEAILNNIRQTQDEGGKALILVDADFPSKGWGFSARQHDVLSKMSSHEVVFPLFIYPNNKDDGDVETLMESLARKDLHQEWWDCFEDYETCVKGAKDKTGNYKYNLPNRKAKLHTYISSQMLCKKKREMLGKGDWLFADSDYWDLSRCELKPLLDFFATNLSC